MTQEITQITGSNPVELMSDRELLAETYRLLLSLDETLMKLMSAGASGGARGFRQALGQVANGR